MFYFSGKVDSVHMRNNWKYSKEAADETSPWLIWETRAGGWVS